MEMVKSSPLPHPENHSGEADGLPSATGETMEETNPAETGPPASVSVAMAGLAKPQFQWEGWSADLATGLIRIGEIARKHYGLQNKACGFVDFVRASEPKDQRHILSLLEEASLTSLPFCYSTVIRSTGGERYPLFCVGESTVEENAASGRIDGLFAFPHIQLDPGRPII